MRKAYYIESKSFFTNVYGYDTMVADLGQIPVITTSQKKGEERYYSMIETYNNLLNHETIKEYTLEEIGIGNCMARTALRNKTTGSRTIISLYQIWI